jgi:hypothetical protein
MASIMANRNDQLKSILKPNHCRTIGRRLKSLKGMFLITAKQLLRVRMSRVILIFQITEKPQVTQKKDFNSLKSKERQTPRSGKIFRMETLRMLWLVSS